MKSNWLEVAHRKARYRAFDRRLSFALSLWLSLAGCSSQPESLGAPAPSVDGGKVHLQEFRFPSTDRELLIRVAALARDGMDALCDETRLEGALGLKIERQRGTTSAATTSPMFDKKTSEVVAVGDPAVQGQYVRLRSTAINQCLLELRLGPNRLCDPRSPATAAAIGVAWALGPDPLHGAPPGAEIQYRFKTSKDGSSMIVLGNTAKKCAEGLVLVGKEERK